jgi:hypothetical protein
MAFSVEWLVIASFAVGGGVGKLADAVIDRELPVSRMFGALFNVIACGTLGLLAGSDPWAATVVLGILLGVLISGKVDSWLHAIGAVVFLVLAMPSLRLIEPAQYLPVLVTVVVGSCADEYLHDGLARGPAKVRRVLQYRCGLDLVLLALVMIGKLPLLYCFAMWTFDAAYIGAQLVISRWSRETSEVAILQASPDTPA